jgi:hypothetical protein
MTTPITLYHYAIRPIRNHDGDTHPGSKST